LETTHEKFGAFLKLHVGSLRWMERDVLREARKVNPPASPIDLIFGDAKKETCTRR
jgi:hypothetical protein